MRSNELEEWESPYCKLCNACREEGCCSALKCAYRNMVENKNPNCMYGESYYRDLEFADKMFNALYTKYTDAELFSKIWNEVYKETK